MSTSNRPTSSRQHGFAGSLLAWVVCAVPVALLGAVLWNSEAAERDPRAGLCDDAAVDQLLYGVVQSDMPALKRALSRGADVNGVNRSGGTPLMCAVNGPPSTAMESIGLLVRAGADVNRGSAYGTTPLMSAVLFQHDDIVRALIAAGADVNACDSNGTTALDIAHACGNDSAEQILLAYRAVARN